MKKRAFVLIIIVIFVFAACSDEAQDQLPDIGVITGDMFYKDIEVFTRAVRLG